MVRHEERKAISPGTKKYPAQPCLHLFSVVSPLCRVGNPLSIPENLFLDYPVITSTSRLTHYAIVEYTTQFGYARLEQIRVLPAREVAVLSA
jgi:hypothetical protein